MPSNLEEQLPRLLRRYLDPVAPTQNTAAGVRRRYADNLYPPYHEAHLPLIPIISLTLLVVLLVGAFVWLHDMSHTTIVGKLAPTTTVNTIIPPNGILTTHFPVHPLAHSPTVNGVTLYIEDFYTDATRTAIHYALMGAHAGPGPLPIIYITDNAGYTLVSGPIGIEEGQGDGRGTDNFTELAPLPPRDLGTSQLLTVTMSYVPLANLTQSDPSPIWKVSFMVAIPGAHNVKSLPAPQKSSGVTMQITHVDWAHAAKQFDGNAGGVRLILHLTGLPPNQPYTIFNFSTQWNGNALNGATNFALAGPWGSVPVPAIAMGLTPYDLASQGLSENVGADGTADIQLVFLLDDVPTSGTAVLSLPQLTFYDSTANGNAPEQILPGPWVFQISIA